MVASTPLNAEPSLPTERQQQDLPRKTYANAAEDGLSQETMSNGTESTLFTGNGEDSAPRSPRRNLHKKPASNGHVKYKKNSRIVIERFQDKEGEHLVSLAPGWENERGKPAAARRQNSELLSGRKAGARWEKSHLHFAPLSVPLKRRLQTLLVLAHTLSVAGLLAVFFFLCSIPLFWPILLPYVIYVLFSDAGSSGALRYRSNFLRSLPLWSLFASYFPARLHRSERLAPTRKYIFGYHPHGIISHGAFAAFGTEALGFSQLFPGITNTLLTLDSNFRVPFYREYILLMGLASVSKQSCLNLLSRGGPNGEGTPLIPDIVRLSSILIFAQGMGRAITIVVGGARESLDAQPHSLKLVLKRRKGFVKLAITTGADLVPVLAFGENELYDQLDVVEHPLVHKAQLVVKKILGFTVPLFHARGVFNYDYGLMPYRRPVNVVVGRPIKVQQSTKPDSSYIDEIHGLYVRELERIWEEWKDEFATERTGDLEIVE